MQCEQIDRKKLPSKRRLTEVLALDPRDPDIVHAKELVQHQRPPIRRAA